MRSLQRILTACAAAIFSQACITGTPPTRMTAVSPAQEAEIVQAGTGKNGLSAADLASVRATNALDALRQLRPEYLRPSTRALSHSTEISLYENGKYAGDIATLALISVSRVIELRRVEPVEARSLFGANCPCDAGVILVRTGNP